MSAVEARLAEHELPLPAPMKLPPGMVLPFSWVRLVGDRAVVSGHLPLDVSGGLALPRGKVGRDLTIDQAQHAASLVALGVMASLKRALGDLDRVVAWVRVFGMVNGAPGFNQQAQVINGFSDTVIKAFGPEVGAHARSAVGMAELPFDVPVEIECEVAFR